MPEAGGREGRAYRQRALQQSGSGQLGYTAETFRASSTPTASRRAAKKGAEDAFISKQRARPPGGASPVRRLGVARPPDRAATKAGEGGGGPSPRGRRHVPSHGRARPSCPPPRRGHAAAQPRYPRHRLPRTAKSARAGQGDNNNSVAEHGHYNSSRCQIRLDFNNEKTINFFLKKSFLKVLKVLKVFFSFFLLKLVKIKTVLLSPKKIRN